MRFSLRGLFVAITLVAFLLFAYRCVQYEVVRSQAPIQLFTHRYEWDGVEYDREVAHSRLARQLTESGVPSTSWPSWATRFPVLGVGSDSSWSPTRSDWFLIERDRVKNHVNLASSDTGFAVIVWLHEKVLWHQLDDQDEAVSRQSNLSMQLHDEWQFRWHDYVASHDD